MEPITEAGKAAQAEMQQRVYDYAIMVIELMKTRKRLSISEIVEHFPYPDRGLVQEAVHLAEQWGNVRFDFNSFAVVYKS